MYTNIIKNSVSYISDQDLFSNNLIEIIKNLDANNNLHDRDILTLFNSNKENIKRELPALLGISSNVALGHDDKSKLHVITSDHHKYNELFSEYKVNPNSDNTTDLTDLKDVIVYYQEYATTTNPDDLLFNPIKHINTIPNIKQHIKTTLEREDNNNQNIYIQKKSPYINRKELNKIIS